MRASVYVGRVGGLAVALGIGAVAFSAVASADEAPAQPATQSVRGAVHAGPGATARPAGQRSRTAATASAVAPSPAAAVPSGVRRSALRGAATRPAASLTLAVSPDRSPEVLAPVAPVTPITPAAPASPSAGTQVATPPVTTSVSGSDRIVVNPTLAWDEGVLTGSLNATSTSDRRLSYVVVSGPSAGGKLGAGPLLPLTNFRPGGEFTYLPYATALTDATETEKFRIMALENSPFDEFVEGLFGDLGELLVPQVLSVLHRIPLVGLLLTPIIGAATIVTFEATPYGLVESRPTAFTYRMPSFDGTPISLNYFPATNVANGQVLTAPTVFAASGLASIANTDPTTNYGQLFPSQQFGSLTPGIAPLRNDAFTSALPGGPSYNGGGGYNVVTWDPRGEFASGGQLQIDNPFFEGRDVSEMVTWLTGASNPARSQIKTVAGDPLVGMTGGSYGGGIQLTTVDPRIDAIVPEIAWNSLLSSLYPNANQFKTGWGTILAAALAVTGARVNPAIYQGILTGALFGWLSQSSQAVLGSVGPTVLLEKEQAPTLLFQGIQDGLFPLQQSIDNAVTISGNPFGPPVKMVWFCGGHGTCLDPVDPFQDARGLVDNLKWLDTYVAGGSAAADTIPAFQWYDQRGQYWTANRLPFQDGFNRPDPLRTTGPGGLLGLLPLIGGSGPYPLNDLPFAITNAGPALNAINLAVTPTAGSQIVGAPTLTFTYSGLGTSRTVYAQIVDNTTKLVLGNIVTPIPVRLDGHEYTVTVPLEDIVYTAGAGESLTLQITSSAINYANFTTAGVINIAKVTLDLPIHAAD